MHKIQTLNKIAPVIHDYLDADNYQIGDDVAQPAGIIVRSAKMHDYEVNAELLAVARAGAGTNNIPSADYGKQGIVVFNTPGANAHGVKEMVICGMLLSARKVVDGINWAQTLKGQGAEVGKLVEKGKKNFGGREITGKKLGIIGMGAIGSLVANSALGFDMDVTGYDPYLSVEAALSLSREVARVDDENAIYENCDYISLHLPLLPATRGKINKELIDKMKDGVVILNFARGELVDTDAIKEALASGKVASYVTDFPNDALLGVDGVIAIPHLGASTAESEENCAKMAAKQLKDYLENGNIVNSVNLPAAQMPRSSACRLAIIHAHQENMVGQITNVLNDHKLSIANMVSKTRGELSYSLIDVESQGACSCTCAESLKGIEGVIRVRCL